MPIKAIGNNWFGEFKDNEELISFLSKKFKFRLEHTRSRALAKHKLNNAGL